MCGVERFVCRNVRTVIRKSRGRSCGIHAFVVQNDDDWMLDASDEFFSATRGLL